MFKSVIVVGETDKHEAKPEPIRVTLNAQPSTKRTVVIMCKSEKRFTLHNFSRIDHNNKQHLSLMFKCLYCDEERVYGVEG